MVTVMVMVTDMDTAMVTLTGTDTVTATGMDTALTAATGMADAGGVTAVSYTHLTLPTILLV